MKTTNSKEIKKLALLALLTAMVAILAYFGGFIKIGSLASISLTLIPIVIGAALHGPWAGAWLGFVSAVVFFTTADAAFWFGLSIPGTVITVIIKGVLAGLFAGIVYNLLKNKNRYLAVIASAIVCPVVNTGIFLGGCFVFFLDTIKAGAAGEAMSLFSYIIIFYVGLNFIFELIANLVLAPTIYRLLNIKKKNFDE